MFAGKIDQLWRGRSVNARKDALVDMFGEMLDTDLIEAGGGRDWRASQLSGLDVWHLVFGVP